MSAKPLICTFYELAYALHALHQNDRALLASLHDIWKLGAPSPGSIVRLPKHFDERRPMHRRGANFVERLILPGPLSAWIQDIAARRGLDLALFDAESVVQMLSNVMGRTDYRIPQPFRQQVKK